jgi:hypothetical protein
LCSLKVDADSNVPWSKKQFKGLKLEHFSSVHAVSLSVMFGTFIHSLI